MREGDTRTRTSYIVTWFHDTAIHYYTRPNQLHDHFTPQYILLSKIQRPFNMKSPPPLPRSSSLQLQPRLLPKLSLPHPLELVLPLTPLLRHSSRVPLDLVPEGPWKSTLRNRRRLLPSMSLCTGILAGSESESSHPEIGGRSILSSTVFCLAGLS